MKSEAIDDIRGALNDQLRPAGEEAEAWIWDMFIDPLEAIIQEGDSFYRAGVTMDDGEAVLADRSEWIEVERKWVEKSMTRSAAHLAQTGKSADLLIFQGGQIKALGNGKVGGHLVLFGSSEQPDLENEFFNAQSDFDLYPGKQSSVYFDHGLDPILKTTRLGKGVMEEDGDAGVWIEAQLHLRDSYERAVYELADMGKLGWSSGTAPNLIERVPVKDSKAVWLKQWPLGLDASLTATPAEPRIQAIPLKSWGQNYRKAIDFETLLEGAKASADIDKQRLAASAVLLAAANKVRR